MSDVFVNLNSLIELYNLIKITTASIESVKTAIDIKNKRLAKEWKDRKYRDLESVVLDCQKSLSDILKILSDAEMFISALVKSIQEYENVSIVNHTTFENSVVSQNENQTTIYCLGVLMKGNIPYDYIDVLLQRHTNADSTVRRVFDKFATKLIVQDANYPITQTPHYSPLNHSEHPRGVYYNVADDMDNPRGAGSTYFHELGHMIDHAANSYQYNTSNTVEFGRALMEDGMRVLQSYNNMEENERQAFLNYVRQDFAHSFSDLIDAATNGQLHGRYGHTRSYWQRAGNLQAEAFAHFFEASMGGKSKLELLSQLFPAAFKCFLQMIKDM